ncbi:olfactory receptor 6N1-like [Pelobates fuscus]|uniref:olfactory receptor 6N1-like n=1 Tax=Pelobates fuscus TaxID=191477 RepID=UPI002FE46CFF
MNQTEIREFLLLGFQNIQIFNRVLFVLFLLIYILTLISNLLIIILVAKVSNLKSPMYFFLSQLSLSDILLTTNITPNMLQCLITGGHHISINGCLTQLGFHCISSGAECLLLTAMSYDRYLAICDPLHYISIMDHRCCLLMALCSWLLAFLPLTVIILLVSNLHFCGPNVFDHYFCDFGPLLEMSCSEYTVILFVDFALATPYVLFPFLFIIFTYISICITILSISSTTGRQKAFSTCSSHLAVVSMYYGTIIAVYMAPSKGQSINVNKIMSLLYTMGTPFLNPIIYSLRNEEIKKAFVKWTSIHSKRH